MARLPVSRPGAATVRRAIGNSTRAGWSCVKACTAKPTAPAPPPARVSATTRGAGSPFVPPWISRRVMNSISSRDTWANCPIPRRPCLYGRRRALWLAHPEGAGALVGIAEPVRSRASRMEYGGKQPRGVRVRGILGAHLAFVMQRSLVFPLYHSRARSAHGTGPHVLRTIMAICIALFLCNLCKAESTADSPLERRVKAAFLYRFTEFVTLPEITASSSTDSYFMVIVGSDAMTEELRQ